MKDDRLIEMRVFRAVAESGGFTTASTALDVGQPYISKTIANLERRLGVALLRRSTRRMGLTDEGKLYLATCNRILSELELSENQIAGSGQRLSGDIRLTAATTFGMDQIVPMLPDFLGSHPDIRVRLSLSDIPADLIGEGFDLAIRMGKPEDSNLVSRKLCHLQRIVVGAPGYVDKHGAPKRPEELVHHNCLMWEPPMEHMNHWRFVVDGKQVVQEVRGNFQASSGMSSVYMCMQGIGLARMAEHMVLPFVKRGLLTPLLQPFQAQDATSIYALYPRDEVLPPRVRALINHIAARLDPPPWVD